MPTTAAGTTLIAVIMLAISVLLRGIGRHDGSPEHVLSDFCGILGLGLFIVAIVQLISGGA